MAASKVLLFTAVMMSLDLCTSSIIPSQNSDLTKWSDEQDNSNSLDKREVVKTWKKGPPPGWWYHTNGHPEGKRFVPSSVYALKKEDYQSDSMLEDFVLFLRLKDSGLLDICMGQK